jgi:hypothetical protein
MQPAPPTSAAQLFSRDQAQGKPKARDHVLLYAAGGTNEQHLGADLTLRGFGNRNAREQMPACATRSQE